MAPNDNSGIQTAIHHTSPSNAAEWNSLCLLNDNLLLSTHYDTEQAYFNQRPVYIELRKDSKLIAGLKVYYYISNKLPGFMASISTRLTQFGEFVYDENCGVYFEEIKNLLTVAVAELVKEKKIAVFQSICFYGGTDKIIVLDYPEGSKSRNFSVGYVPLGKTEDELWKQLHPTQRQNVTKAKKHPLVVVKSDDIDTFNKLLDESYRRQEKEPPTKKYIEHHYAMLKQMGAGELYFVKHGEEILSGALMHRYGKSVYYAFAGTLLNNYNAGHFLHWNLILDYNKTGITRYIMGEVASEVDDKNLKFTQGITQFKTRFGTVNIPSAAREYIIRPSSLRLWQFVQKIVSKLIKFG